MAYNQRPSMMQGVSVPTMVGGPFTLATNLVPAVRLPMTLSQPMSHSQMRLNPPLPSQPPLPPQNSSPNITKLLPYSQRVESSGPAVTVFVGNITEKAPDVMIRHILNACGPVLTWKRVQGASGKLQGFGFCEFANPAAALRAIRLLHNYEIASKMLNVKADSNTTEILDAYKDKRKKSLQQANGNDCTAAPGTSSPLQDEKPVDDEDFLDDEMRLEDKRTSQRINQILMEHRKEIQNYIAPPNRQEARDKRLNKVQEKLGSMSSDSAGIPSTLNLDDMEDVEEGKKELISREITQFREQMKKQEEEKERDRRTRDKDRDRDREREIRDKDRDRERDREREKERERDRYEREEKRRSRRSKSRSCPIVRRSRTPMEDKRSRKDKKRSKSRTRSPHRSEKDILRHREIEVEDKERKDQERKVRKKEIQYQERLKNWETREAKKKKELLREQDREKDKVDQRERDATSLRQFLEDYDDERDDPKYYKGHLFERKLVEREQEKESDARDRAKEKDELQDLRSRINTEGHQDPDAAFEKAKLEREALYNPKPILPHTIELDNEEKGNHTPDEPAIVEVIPAPKPARTPPPPPEVPMETSQTPVDAPEPSDDDDDETDHHEPQLPSPSPQEEHDSPQQPPPEADNSPKPSRKKKLDVRDVFNQDDDEEHAIKKRKLPPPSKDKTKDKGGEEKRQHIKSLIDGIPTTKEELFAFPIEAGLVDNTLMEKRIRPWVNKKIVEYIGEPEPTLVDFICSKVLVGSDPESILHDVQMVLDDEAEVFVVKMWRLLIYEIEAKKIGIGKV